MKPSGWEYLINMIFSWRACFEINAARITGFPTRANDAGKEEYRMRLRVNPELHHFILKIAAVPAFQVSVLSVNSSLSIKIFA